MERYRNNPFSILGVAADATPRDVHRARDTCLRAAEAGIPAISSSLLPFLPEPVRGPRQVELAAHELAEPLKRLRYELFWPAAGKAGVLPELVGLLREREYRVFFQQAERVANGAGPEASLARHLLAVASHALAIEGSRGCAPADLESFCDWNKALARWRAIQDDDLFWDLIRERVARAGDPRLGPESITALRKGLATDLTQANKEIGWQEDREGRGNGLNAQIHILRNAPFEAQATRPALAALYLAAKARFDSQVASIGAKLGDAAIAEQPKEYLNGYLNGIESDVIDGLIPTGRLLPDDRSDLPVAEEMREQLAKLLRALSLAWNNDADAPANALRVTTLAISVPLSPAWQGIFSDDQVKLKQLAAQQAAAAKALKRAPGLGTYNGIGKMLYGRRNIEAGHDARSESYIATLCFTVFYLPVLALSAYRVVAVGRNTWRFLSREPLSRLAKTWNWMFCAICSLLLIAAIASGGGNSTVGTDAGQYATTTPAARSGVTTNPADPLAILGGATPPASGNGDTTAGADGTVTPAMSSTKQKLGDWIDTETARLKAEKARLDLDGSRIDAERTRLDADRATTQTDIDAFNGEIESFNRRLDTWKAAVRKLNDEIGRYNSMQ